MATEINPLIIPFDSLLVTRSKREYRETVQGWGEEPCEGDQAAQEMQKHIQNMKRDGRYGKRGYR